MISALLSTSHEGKQIQEAILALVTITLRLILMIKPGKAVYKDLTELRDGIT